MAGFNLFWDFRLLHGNIYDMGKEVLRLKNGLALSGNSWCCSEWLMFVASATSKPIKCCDEHIYYIILLINLMLDLRE